MNNVRPISLILARTRGQKPQGIPRAKVHRYRGFLRELSGEGRRRFLACFTTERAKSRIPRAHRGLASKLRMYHVFCLKKDTRGRLKRRKKAKHGIGRGGNDRGGRKRTDSERKTRIGFWAVSLLSSEIFLIAFQVGIRDTLRISSA